MQSEDASILFSAIHKTGYRINNWESNFIKSIKDQLEMGVKLTEKQSNKLQQIYRKAMESMSMNERI